MSAYLPGFNPLTGYVANPRQREIVANVLLFGGGLDSHTLLELMVDGVIPERPDLIVFSDTNAEPTWVYQWLQRARWNAERLGVTFVHTHYSCRPWDEIRLGACHGSPPFWLDTGQPRPGRLARQCTDYLKVRPGQHYTKLWLHERGILDFRIEDVGDFGQWYFSPFPRHLGVRTWIGYTADETARFWKPRQIGWQIPYYPLAELGMTRADCAAYWRAKGLPAPRRSACFYCPNRSDAEWREFAQADPLRFEEACALDAELRRLTQRHGPFAKVRAPMYVHPSRRPLAEVFG